jgi:hypothetical protein
MKAEIFGGRYSQLRGEDLKLRPSGYEHEKSGICLASQPLKIIHNVWISRGICLHRGISGRHVTSHNFRSPWQPGVNGIGAGKKLEGCG